jgi:hypothetical protein
VATLCPAASVPLTGGMQGHPALRRSTRATGTLSSDFEIIHRLSEWAKPRRVGLPQHPNETARSVRSSSQSISSSAKVRVFG